MSESIEDATSDPKAQGNPSGGAGLGETPCSKPTMKDMSDSQDEPLRCSYSREELMQKLTDWMVKIYGSPTSYADDPDQRDAWYRDNGLIAHFIRDHF